MNATQDTQRLEQLRAAIRAEHISYGEIAELHVNAYCPECSRIHSEREGHRVTCLDCDYDTDK